MNAVVMDRVVVEDESIISALCFVSADSIIPKRSVVVGNPHKIVKQVSNEMLEWKKGRYMRVPGIAAMMF
jgi:phenylacetic acid degradation protein